MNIANFETDSKNTILRAIANSAIFRLFNLTDYKLHFGEEEEQDKLETEAFVLLSIYTTLVDHLSTASSFYHPMTPENVLELITQQRQTSDEGLNHLSKVSGLTVDQLKKMRKQAIDEQVAKGKQKVKRSGDEFLLYTQTEATSDFSQLGSWTHSVDMDIKEIAIKGLKNAMSSSLKQSLLGYGEGAANIMFFKEAIDEINKSGLEL